MHVGLHKQPQNKKRDERARHRNRAQARQAPKGGRPVQAFTTASRHVQPPDDAGLIGAASCRPKGGPTLSRSIAVSCQSVRAAKRAHSSV